MSDKIHWRLLVQYSLGNKRQSSNATTVSFHTPAAEDKPVTLSSIVPPQPVSFPVPSQRGLNGNELTELPNGVFNGLESLFFL